MDPACADSPGADRGLARRVAPPSACHTRRMNESAGYAVFFFAPALEALGDAIKPYLQDGQPARMCLAGKWTPPAPSSR